MKIISSGYTSIDRIIKISTAPQVGQTSIITNRENTQLYFGGCSPNIACNLAKLGLDTYPIMRVGHDFDSSGYRQYLTQANVKLDYVEQVAEDVTSFSLLMEDPQLEHTTFFYPGAQSDKYFSPPADASFHDAAYGIITVGDLQDNRAFLAKCRQHDIPVVFGMRGDASAFPKDFLLELLTQSRIIFMNRLEAEHIREYLSLNAISDLFSLGQADVIVITLGQQGSQYFTPALPQGSQIFPACRCKVVDTTGSGDAYISGFMYGISEQYPLDECCMLGGTLSAFVIEAIGCTTNAPNKQQLVERFNQFKASLQGE